LSDDEALILPSPDGGIVAHPFPTWSDFIRGSDAQDRRVEHGVPLSAVFFLSQAPKDRAVALGRGEAAAWMTATTLRYFTRPGWKSSHPEDEVSLRARVFDNACKLAARVPSFELGVSLNGRFWDEIERVTKKW
jgi:SynChlorMet cassette protein ScmC